MTIRDLREALQEVTLPEDTEVIFTLKSDGGEDGVLELEATLEKRFYNGSDPAAFYIDFV